MKSIAGAGLVGFVIGHACHWYHLRHGHWLIGPDCVMQFCLAFVLAIAVGSVVQTWGTPAAKGAGAAAAVLGLWGMKQSFFFASFDLFSYGCLLACLLIAVAGLAVTCGWRSENFALTALATGIGGYGVASWAHQPVASMCYQMSPNDGNFYVWLYYVVPAAILGLLTGLVLVARKSLTSGFQTPPTRRWVFNLVTAAVFIVLVVVGIVLPSLRPYPEGDPRREAVTGGQRVA